MQIAENTVVHVAGLLPGAWHASTAHVTSAVPWRMCGCGQWELIKMQIAENTVVHAAGLQGCFLGTGATRGVNKNARQYWFPAWHATTNAVHDVCAGAASGS